MNYPVYPKYAGDYPKNYPPTFTAYNNANGEIIKAGRDGDKIVGVDLQRYEEERARAEKAEAQRGEFYQKLVECGIIEEEKTPEQEAQEAMSLILAELKSIKSENAIIKKELKSIKGAKSNGRNVNNKKTAVKRKAKSNDSKGARNVGRDSKQGTTKPIPEE